MAVSPIYVDIRIAGDHEVFENTDPELQDVVRLELQWASFVVMSALSRPEKAL